MRITDVRVFPIANFGQDPTRIEPIWQDVFGVPSGAAAPCPVRPGRHRYRPVDLIGKALGVPCYRLLGGSTRDMVLVYRHVGGGTPEELCCRRSRRIGQGNAGGSERDAVDPLI